MKISYTQNPLTTIVELDDHDKEILLLKVEIEFLKDAVCVSSLYLRDDRPRFPMSLFNKKMTFFSVEKARKELSRLDNKEKWIGKIRSYVETLEQELKEPHCGDCTCIPCSCSKCFAESLLGIDTIAGLGKHPANDIAGVFRKLGDITCQEAIDYMEANPVTATEDWHAPHIERWSQDRKLAIEWMKKYQQEHLK